MTGQQLREWRTERGKLQTEMAKAVGVSVEALSLWERKHTDIDLGLVVRENNRRALVRYIRAVEARER